MPRVLLILVSALCFFACKVDPLKITRTRTSTSGGNTFKYMIEKVAGWDIYVEDTLWLERPKLTLECLKTIQERLSEIALTLPENAVQNLRSVPIYITSYPADEYIGLYHPSEVSLGFNRQDIGKVKSVEIMNPKQVQYYLGQKGSLLMHELAHAYEDIFFTKLEKTELERIYKAAMEEFKYQAVPRTSTWSTALQEHYASKNAHEYFAELSVSYWGKNYYYPFTREDILEYDPRMYQFLERVWNEVRE